MDIINLVSHHMVDNKSVILSTADSQFSHGDGLDQCWQALWFVTCHAYQENRLKFIILILTKTRQGSPPIEACYPDFWQSQGCVQFVHVNVTRCDQSWCRPLLPELHRSHCSVQRPHKLVKAATIGPWLKGLIRSAGINKAQFTVEQYTTINQSNAGRFDPWLVADVNL